MADSSKIGRNILVVGIVLGIGAIGGGYYIYNLPDTDTLDVRMPQAKAADNGLTDEAAQVVRDVSTMRRMVDVAPGLDVAFVPRDKVEGKKVPRYTPLFFAPTIWEVPDAAQKKNIAVDLLAVDPNKPPHPLHTVTAEDGTSKAVPNAWFYTYGIEQNMCDVDAMRQDPDGDGFTNAEEFLAGKDPSDSSDMPSFVAGDTVKLVSVGKKSVHRHLMELSRASSFADNTANVVIFDSSGTQRLRRHEALKPGDKFGFGDEASGPMGKERFTLEKIDTVTDDTGVEAHLVHIRDSYTRLSDATEFDLKEGSRARREVRDTQLKFRVIAGPMKGKPEAEISAQLGETFEIPGFAEVQCQFSEAGDKKTPPKVKVNGDKEYAVPSAEPVPPKKSK